MCLGKLSLSHPTQSKGPRWKLLSGKRGQHVRVYLRPASLSLLSHL